MIEVRMPFTKRQAKRIAKAKGRPGGRVLKSAQVIEAKTSREKMGLTFRELAKIYDVSAATMHRALRLYL